MPVIAVIRLHVTPGQIGLLSASAVLPVLLLGLPAGALADRIRHPRRTLLALDTASALMIATIAVGLTRGAVTIGWLAPWGGPWRCCKWSPRSAVCSAR